MTEFLQWLNLLWLPVVGYLMRIEHRLTKIETTLALKIDCGKKS